MKISRRTFMKGVSASALAGSAAVLGIGTQPTPAHAAPTLERPSAPLPRELEENVLDRLQVKGSTDPLAASTEVISENMEPVILHPEQLAAVKAKLNWFQGGNYTQTFEVCETSKVLDVGFKMEPV